MCKGIDLLFSELSLNTNSCNYTEPRGEAYVMRGGGVGGVLLP